MSGTHSAPILSKMDSERIPRRFLRVTRANDHRKEFLAFEESPPPAGGSFNPVGRYPEPAPGATRKPKLLDRLREALRSRHYSPKTEQSYCHWVCLPRREASRRRQVKRFIHFHHVRHPGEMAEPEINSFLTYLAIKEKVSASTQNQALSALLFLYRYVLDRKYPNAPADWRWQWVFPQENRWKNPKTGEEGRHHLDESLVQKAVRDAVARAGLTKRATCHTFRHSFLPVQTGATHLLEGGYDIPVCVRRTGRPVCVGRTGRRTIQELLGHSDVKTTMIYTHVLNRGPAGVRSPMDGL